MKQETAKQVQSILNEIDKRREKLEWLSEEERLLVFGTQYTNSISVHECQNFGLKEILDKHHKMIIQELKDKIKELEKQLEEL